LAFSATPGFAAAGNDAPRTAVATGVGVIDAVGVGVTGLVGLGLGRGVIVGT